MVEPPRILQLSSHPASPRDRLAVRRVCAADLLRRAASYYDEPGGSLRTFALRRAGFASGARWMALALATIRERHRSNPSPEPLRIGAGARVPHNYHMLGVLKYGLAGVAALLWVVATLVIVRPELLCLAVAVFYAIEAQLVFLFPIALDGSPTPFREARRWTVRAGGTWKVMQVVLPLAASMLGGGFLGRGFVRSWCVGCLAVCVWYEDLRGLHQAASPLHARALPLG